MIAQVEAQARERLGDVIFGADEDTLEDVTLTIVAKRGWKLIAVESDLNGLLARMIPNTASYTGLAPEVLMDTLRDARTDSNADAAVGAAIYLEERAVELALITPAGEKTHRLTYGGPPRSLALWAANLALNLLRTHAKMNDEA